MLKIKAFKLSGVVFIMLINVKMPTIVIVGILTFTVKPALGGHSKIDKTKAVKTNGSLMKVESIAECSLGAFCNTFNLH